MSKLEFKFNADLRVRWSECDAQGIVYNACYVTYIDIIQGEYFRNLGLNIYSANLRQYFDMVTVKATLEYKSPARLDDLVTVYIKTSKIGVKSLTMNAEMYRSKSDDLLNKSEMIYVAFNADTGLSRCIPNDIRLLIENYEETGATLPIANFPDLSDFQDSKCSQ